ncbi:MAG: sensor histidine kinase [Saprospiraceae bacterium]
MFLKRSKKELIGIDDKWLVLLGIPVVSVLSSLLMFHEQISLDPRWLFGCIPISFVYTVIFWFCLRAVILFCRDRFFEDHQLKMRLSAQLVLVLVIYALLKLGVDYFIEDLHGFFGSEDHPNTLGTTISSLTVCFLVISIYDGIFYYSRYQNSLLEQERLRKQQIASQLEGLKNQVNPHFLFNSMNTLAQLIPEDSARAVKFVEKLSKVYRYILEIKDKELVTLEEELTFLRAYLFLLKERFEENLQVEVSIPEEHLQKKVLPLSLQLLIENAIKHNITSTEQPLSITVMIKDGKLYVENKLQRKNQVMHSTKMGLENIKSRYSFFTQVRVLIEETADRFSVALPLID